MDGDVDFIHALSDDGTADRIVNVLALLLVLEGDLTEESFAHLLGVRESAVLPLLCQQLVDVLVDYFFHRGGLSILELFCESVDVGIDDLFRLDQLLTKSHVLIVPPGEHLDKVRPVQIRVEQELDDHLAQVLRELLLGLVKEVVV